MSETNDQPVAETAAAAATSGVDGQGAAPNDDISTEDFDRMPAPEGEDDPEAAEAGEGAPKPADTLGAADDDEEVELSDGRKVKVPKELAQGNLRHADYTKKTMDLAEQRRAHEQAVSTWQSQQAESLKAFRAEHVAIATSEAQLARVGEDLAKYRQMTPADWAALKAQDSTAYDQHAENYEQLRRYRTTLEENLTEAKTTLSAKEAKAKEDGDKARTAAIAEGLQKAEQVLTKTIPGWNRQLWTEAATFATKELGISAEELQETTDPRIWKMVHDLRVAKAELAKAKTATAQADKAAQNTRAQAIRPAEKTSGTAAPRGVNDDLGTKEWMRRRQAQLARKSAS